MTGAALLLFARVLGVMLAAPGFGHAAVPWPVRILLAVSLTGVLLAVVPPASAGPGLLLGLPVELLFGLAMGYVASLAVFTAQVSGEILDAQNGLTLVTLLSPTTGVSSVTGQLLGLMALEMFMSGGYRLVLVGLYASLRMVPLGQAAVHAATLRELVLLTGGVLAGGVALALPVIAGVLLANVLLAVMSRLLPQANVLGVALSVEPPLSIFLLLVSLPVVAYALGQLLSGIGGQLLTLARSVHP